jgi:hypothetical protein
MAALSQVMKASDKELREVAKRSDPSVLRQRSFNGLSSEDWMSEVLHEMATRCPTVHKILSVVLESEIDAQKKNPAICLIYGIVMFLRCHELSRIQRINSVLLTQGQASVNVSL